MFSKRKRFIGLAIITCLVITCVAAIYAMNKENDLIVADEAMDAAQYVDCVVGLISDGVYGSVAVVYDTETWTSTTLLELPDVTPDNYTAISSDGNYIAYTTWDEYYARRYIVVYSVATGVITKYFTNIPARNEIIKISWLPDNKTLLFIKNDANMSSYQEIQTFDVETGASETLIRGEVWSIRVAEEMGNTAEDFYLRGHDEYLSVKEMGTVLNSDGTIEWQYYLNQNDMDEIYAFYGGRGSFPIEDVINLMYVEFSAPRCSVDGSKMVYSTRLTRNAAPLTKEGDPVNNPLWMVAAVWIYDMETKESSIIYVPNDGAAIGRVDWVSDHEIVFISYYDMQGSRNSINYLDITTGEHKILYPYTEDNYNNVTLLPIGGGRITFTSSAKDQHYDESVTMLFDINQDTVDKIDIMYNDEIVLLQNFIYNRLLCVPINE